MENQLPPNYAEECAVLARLRPGARVCGVDEVGRGPFAGPVVACAAWLSRDAADALEALGLDDSKKLNSARLAALDRAIRDHCADGAAAFGLGAASVRDIEIGGIGRATDLAMRRATARLAAQRRLDHALVDGNRAPRGLGVAATPLVKGDARSLSIAAAAVLAKVARDRAMRRLASRWPGYGWETNVGYGTEAHRDALRRLGPTPHHRSGFVAKTLGLRQSVDNG